MEIATAGARTDGRFVQRAYVSAETVGSSMLVVDALNERAAVFYESFGFQPLPESLRLVLPMRSIEELLARTRAD